MNIEIHKFEGSHKLTEIQFKHKNKDQEYYIWPDVVLLEGDEYTDHVNYKDLLYLPSLKEHPDLDSLRQDALMIDNQFKIHHGV